MHFRIIKLTNNDNHKEFTLEITKMKDIRHRLGILESNYKDYLLSNERHKPSYNILSKSNYSYYTVLRGEFDTFEEVKQKRKELYDIYKSKVMHVKEKEYTNIVSFNY